MRSRLSLTTSSNRTARIIACLGDVVGYNANPKECLDIVRKHGHALRQGQSRRYC